VSETGAEGIRWDLTLLAPSQQAMKDRLETAVAAAKSFSDRWPVESITAIEPAALGALLRELAELRAVRMESKQWVFLLAETDAEDPAVRDLEAWVDGRLLQLDDALRHFELAWIDVPDERAEHLVEDAGVVGDRHYLLSLRRFRPFLLSRREERVLAARETTARSAWQALYLRTLGSLTANFDDGGGEREWSLSELESASRGHPNRDLRRRASKAVQLALEPVLPVLAQCYDALVADHLAVDGVRGHTDPMERRNLENEIDPGAVERLLKASEAHYELARRWFRLKARLLGLDCADTIDFSAPALDVPVIRWEEGHRLAVGVFTSLTPTLGREANAFFEERRIDAELRRGKRFGGMCVWPSTRTPGFLYLNWSGGLLDLVMLVHELGHGTHFAHAARAQSDHSFLPGLTIAEVPSTFAHLRLVEGLLSDNSALALPVLAKTLDTAVMYVFVRIALTRYEQEAYAMRARGEALTSERLSDLCEAQLATVAGDAMTDELRLRRTMWASMPHFVHERFYLYAYAFAFLLAAGLLVRSKESEFAERYERFLAAGGSASPDELMSIIGVDLSDSGIWDEGFSVIEGWLDRIDA
jgi:oligoendopeptidase F